MRFYLACLFALSIGFVCRSAAAETWQAPAGGRSIPPSDGRVVCTPPVGDWTLDPDGRSLRPPASEEGIGRASTVSVAASTAACASAATTITLVTTGKVPVIDAAATTLAVDDGRLDLRGRNLRGVGITWHASGKSGDERCVQSQADAAGERCAVAVPRGLPADPSAVSLTYLPAGARAGADVVTYDSAARIVSRDDLTIRPGKFAIARVVAADASVDLAGGGASRVALVHPEAVASAECTSAQCELSGGALVVRGVVNAAGTIAIKLRLAPRVYLQRGDALDAAPSIDVPVLPCTMTVASGDALRGVDDSRVVVRLDARCATDARNLRFFANGRAADLLMLEQDGAAALVLLRVGRVDGDELSISASRADSDRALVGTAHARARPLVAPRAVLELENHDAVDFIPTNRRAIVRFADVPGPARFVLVPVEGVYDVALDAAGDTTIAGSRSAAGYVALRFAYRMPTLPGALAQSDLAVLVEPIERPMHEANVPIALGASIAGRRPIAELVCSDAGGRASRVVPGTVTHVPFEARDGCRLVLHRELLSPEDGAQSLNLEIEITRVDGTPRPEAHLSQPIVVRAAKDARYLWIKGVQAPFDRITVRLAHASDESRYVGAADAKGIAPSAQWSVVAGTGHARLYATTAIPTGLYRVSDGSHSGLLALNFGLVARLTWLDSEGHEGFLGAEAGVMGMGLANDVDASGHSLTQVATVTGFGLSVPIANRSLATETSINLHAWFEYEVSRDLGHQPGSPFGFVFGPSISIGNVGSNL